MSDIQDHQKGCSQYIIQHFHSFTQIPVSIYGRSSTLNEMHIGCWPQSHPTRAQRQQFPRHYCWCGWLKATSLWEVMSWIFYLAHPGAGSPPRTGITEAARPESDFEGEGRGWPGEVRSNGGLWLVATCWY